MPAGNKDAITHQEPELRDLTAGDAERPRLEQTVELLALAFRVHPDENDRVAIRHHDVEDLRAYGATGKFARAGGKREHFIAAAARSWRTIAAGDVPDDVLGEQAAHRCLGDRRLPPGRPVTR